MSVPLTMTSPYATLLPTGNKRLDAYLAGGYGEVRGMSSAFSAAICGHLIRRQTELGISGHIAEIGTFEGRFFIALALGLARNEHAIGIDVFTWPSEQVLTNLHENCARHGLARRDYTAIKGDTSRMMPVDVLAPVRGGGHPGETYKIRFFHVDGQHDDKHLSADLALVLPLMHQHGLIVLDDMLHPGYPELVDTVHRWLRANRDYCVLAILDREDIVAAAKYVLCRKEAVALYEQDLLETFAAKVYPLGADICGHFSIVLTPQPRLAVVD
jgi:predicted O-methyltransferase YrrM